MLVVAKTGKGKVELVERPNPVPKDDLAVVNPTDKYASEQIQALAGGRGVDKAVECSGVGGAAQLCIRSVRRKGQVALVGGPGDFSVNGWRDVISKGLTLHGTWHWNLADTPRILRIIHDGGGQINKLITHVFPMRDVEEAWKLRAGGNCGKVLLQPWD